MTEAATNLPDAVSPYKQTPDFTEQTIPAGLLKAHSTKEGAWGLIRILEGELLYRIVDERRRPSETLLRPGRDGIVEPGILHQVQPVGTVRFHVQFFR